MTVQLAARAECVIGEGPVWHPDEDALYWVDIAGKAVYRLDPSSDEVDCFPVDAEVGVIGLWHDSTWIAAGSTGIDRLELPSGAITSLADPEASSAASRFNDGKVDRRGRFWAGTMTPTGAESSLYRVDVSLDVARVDGPFTISNGIGWSPTGDVMYFVDSLRYVIHRYDFDEGTGTVANRSDVVVFDPADGIPDGLTVDERGDIWCAMYGASCVVRISPDGEVLEAVPVPVSRPTACIFGGPDYETLYVTSARDGLSAAELAREPLAGSVFCVRPGVGGRPEPRFFGPA